MMGSQIIVFSPRYYRRGRGHGEGRGARREERNPSVSLNSVARPRPCTYAKEEKDVGRRVEVCTPRTYVKEKQTS